MKMKKKILYTFFITLIAVVTSSCTRNNGDIGELFGQWKVTSITADGKKVSDYNGVMYFAFQSSVYCQKIVNEETHWDDCVFAKWKYEGNGVLIDFTGTGYIPFSCSGMSEGQNYVEIESRSNDDMIMSYTSSEEVEYVYTLKKW